MIRTTTGCFIKPLEIVKIEIVNNRIDHTDRIVRRYVLINLPGKEPFGWERNPESVFLWAFVFLFFLLRYRKIAI